MNNESPAKTDVVPTRFGWRFSSLFLLGMVGVAVLPLEIVPLMRSQPTPSEGAQTSIPMLVALVMVQTMLLLAGAVALGTALAHRVGLRSYVAGWAQRGTAVIPHLRSDLLLAIVLGALLAVVTRLLDVFVFEPNLRDIMPPGEAD